MWKTQAHLPIMDPVAISGSRENGKARKIVRRTEVGMVPPPAGKVPALRCRSSKLLPRFPEWTEPAQVDRQEGGCVGVWQRRRLGLRESGGVGGGGPEKVQCG